MFRACSSRALCTADLMIACCRASPTTSAMMRIQNSIHAPSHTDGAVSDVPPLSETLCLPYHRSKTAAEARARAAQRRGSLRIC
jgi:nucleoside-diphosphate-sugar epimerase